ncbi:hypothetical protein NI379_08375 [Vibrio parahaemolyticus]|nr:hypothetical protein [Vibrio parahaemolyticus]WMO02026.1 hypothetical protein NI379_08375 [Vibrio parahaemolyticus]HCG6674565.1 hypothetical protein [Vibrio parahaemolyticus]
MSSTKKKTPPIGFAKSRRSSFNTIGIALAKKRTMGISFEQTDSYLRAAVADLKFQRSTALFSSEYTFASLMDQSVIDRVNLIDEDPEIQGYEVLAGDPPFEDF